MSVTAEAPKVPLYRRDLLFIDVETTGLDPERHELLELAAVRRTFDRQIVGTFEARILPRRIETADAKALEVNGYTPDGWAEASGLEEVLLAFADFATGSAILVGHNVAFDRGFLLANFRRVGLAMPVLDYHAIDTASLAWPLCAQGLVERVKLETLCGHFGVSNEGAHGAMRDVERAIAIYDRLVPVLVEPVAERSAGT